MPSHASNVTIWDDPVILAYNNLQTASEGHGHHNPPKLAWQKLAWPPKVLSAQSTKELILLVQKDVSSLVYSCYCTLNHSLDLAQHSRILCTFKKTFLSSTELHCDIPLPCTAKLTHAKNKIKKHTNKSASLLILICTALARIHCGSLKNSNTHINGKASPSQQLGQSLRIP